MAIQKWRCALALAAWYLMSAPFVGPTTNRRLDPSAPITRWQILAPFASHAGCQDELENVAWYVANRLFSKRANVVPTLRCVSGDDLSPNYFGRALADQLRPPEFMTRPSHFSPSSH